MIEMRFAGRLSLLCALTVSACAGAAHRVDQEELGPGFADRSFGDLLIVGVYEDRTFRVASETAFAEELAARGVGATASYTSIDDLGTLDDETALRRALEGTTHDALLTVATIDAGYEYDYEDYLETRGLVYLLGGRPGAGTDLGSFISWAGSGIYKLHIGLWDAETLSPIWQITTNSETTGSESGDTAALAQFVVEALREKGLVESAGQGSSL